MISIQKQIAKIVDEELVNIYTQLLGRGVNKMDLDDVFRGKINIPLSEVSTYVKSQKSTSSTNDEQEDVGEYQKPAKRMLSSASSYNYGKNLGPSTVNSQRNAPLETQAKSSVMETGNSKLGIWDKTGKVFIVDYTEKSFVLLGDFWYTHLTFKTEKLTSNKNYTFNDKLAVGSGWVFWNSNLIKVRKELEEYGIVYKELTREQITAIITETKLAAEKKPVMVKTVVNKAVVKPVVSKPVVSKSKGVNKYGNNEDSEGFIMMNLPIGTGGKKEMVCIGVQDPEPKKGLKGLATVCKLDKITSGKAELKKYKILKESMLILIKKHDSKCWTELTGFLDKREKSESSTESSSSSSSESSSCESSCPSSTESDSD